MTPDTKKFDYAGRYVTVLALLTIVGLLVLSGLLTWFGATFLKAHPPWDALSIGLAASLASAVIVYLLLSLFVEPRRLREVMEKTSAYAINYSQSQFREIFADAIPAATYRQSESLGRPFRDSFARHLSPSNDYFFKGSDGSFTAFRLRVLRSRVAAKSIRLCLVNPLDDRAVRGYAYLDLSRKGEGAASPEKILEQSEEFRLDIFATLVALFDLRGDVRSEVYFHSDLPHYRSEILADALYLTYYDGESRFPEILEFSAGSRLYRAYRHAFDTACRYSSGVVIFAEDGPQRDVVKDAKQFQQVLASLGCTHTLDQLREIVHAREDEYDAQLQKAGLTEADLF